MSAPPKSPKVPKPPGYRVFVIPWLRRPAQRLILPNWLAITIWRWIFAWRALDEVELAHELTHVRQWLEHGFVGYIRGYMAESSRAKKDGGDRYRDNRFEVEARAAEDDVRSRLSRLDEQARTRS